MNSEAPHPTTSALAQSLTARHGTSGARIGTSPLARVAHVLHQHDLAATLRPTGSLRLSVSTSRFTAHVVPGLPDAIEVRAQREGRSSILGLLSDADEAAHLIIRCAGLASAWELAAAVHDRLVLAGETSVLAEVPMGDTVFVRLGDRTYAELIAENADPSADEPASITVVTYVMRQSLDGSWRFRDLMAQDTAPMAMIAGGTHRSSANAVAAVERHRSRTAEWERLH